jgi:hypothetical protein
MIPQTREASQTFGTVQKVGEALDRSHARLQLHIAFRLIGNTA